MGQGKRAWIYCAIDAPEDRNGALKSQFKQLIDYGEQMGFELVGSSSDVGTTPLWNRNGFRHFIEAVQKEQVDVLLIVNRGRLSRSSMENYLTYLQTEAKERKNYRSDLYGLRRVIEDVGNHYDRQDIKNLFIKVENEQLLQKCSILQKEVDTLKKRLDRKEIALLKKL